ncbi:MAG: iron-containing alcohol dehydrogenase [Chloroflexi bacterium]|nr:iron-containing alcohol dehydrogenase [Chloroflexota bacterium]
MWFFASPEIVFGEDALSYLSEIEGQRAFIVTDQNIVRLGFVDLVARQLKAAGMEYQTFAEVEPNPTFEMVKRGAAAMSGYGPDWIIGLGGGSCLDAAKAMWVLYERPDMEPEEINPMIPLGLRQKARLITIPTTSGTGAEVTWVVVLTDAQERRKLVLGSRENVADLAIVDPVLVKALPPHIAADTGMDALTHAVEGYTSSWANDFCDGLCLKAIQLVFDYLPRAVANEEDAEARQKMHNAATIAGLGFGNSMGALAHAMGHPLSPLFGVPHGRAVGVFLPYTIEFMARQAPARYAEIARFLGLGGASDADGAASLVEAVRDLARRIKQPASVKELGILREDYEAALQKMIEDGENDTVTSARIPDREELARLFRYAYEGKIVDF